MKTKQEILNYLNSRKEIYQRNILWYNAVLAPLKLDSNDYIMYDLMRKMERAHLYAINDILEFINGKDE